MNNKTGSNIELEILVATMNRNNLSFLDDMFVNNNISKLHILIINQTTSDCLLQSDYDNIRVINSFEKGLSRSRNLAIKNAIGDICLIADDDVVYLKDFDKKIIKGFYGNFDMGLIVFKALDFNGNDYRKYPPFNKQLYINSVKGVISIEIALNRKVLNKNNIFFDERFGLGGQFETGEEYLFSRLTIKNGFKVLFNNNAIVSHDSYNSGKDLGSDKIVYARAALNYCIHKNLVYIWMLKYISFLLKNKYIVPNQIMSKTKIAFNGIRDFKNAK